MLMRNHLAVFSLVMALAGCNSGEDSSGTNPSGSDDETGRLVEPAPLPEQPVTPLTTTPQTTKLDTLIEVGTAVEELASQGESLTIDLISPTRCPKDTANGQMKCTLPTWRISTVAPSSDTPKRTVITPSFVGSGCQINGMFPIRIDIPNERSADFTLQVGAESMRIRSKDRQSITSLDLSVPASSPSLLSVSADCQIQLKISFNEEDTKSAWNYGQPSLMDIKAQNGVASVEIISSKVCPTSSSPNGMHDCWWPVWRIESPESQSDVPLQTQLALVTEGDCDGASLPAIQIEIPGEWPLEFRPIIEKTAIVRRTGGKAITEMLLSGRGMLPFLRYKQTCKMSVRIKFNEPDSE